MVTLPQPTIDAIYSSYETKPRKHRTYLGLSRLGEECRRQLWYEFRWAWLPKYEGRILRLFETGEIEEDRIIKNLQAIGCTVEGRQHEVQTLDGWVAGHFDGVVLGLPEAPKTWHLFEGKTMSKKHFNATQKHGVEKSKPTYYAQVQLYMHLGELKRAVFIAQCKDDDRLYLERIKYDSNLAKQLLRKAATIIKSETIPDRLSDDPTFYKCRFCNYNYLCHQKVYPEVNCRTCVHWDLGLCQHGYKYLASIGRACGSHLYIPSMLHWLEPLSGDPDTIVYTNDITNHRNSEELYRGTLPKL
jgi:CRISPR/Cas system-associated exonuclease Cas4 (RecB family)